MIRPLAGCGRIVATIYNADFDVCWVRHGPTILDIPHARSWRLHPQITVSPGAAGINRHLHPHPFLLQLDGHSCIHGDLPIKIGA